MPGWLAPVACGFVYWLVFLLVLEPDNLLRAWQAGHLLPFGREATRIAGAALLGATTAAPVQWRLTRAFPLDPGPRWRHALIHLAGNAGLAFALIVGSCFLAAWGFEKQLLPSLTEVRSQLVSNGTLLLFPLSAFTAIAHVQRGGMGQPPTVARSAMATEAAVFQPARDAKTASVEPERAGRVAIKVAGRLRLVEQASIDWMESQGNYLALHAGPTMHLIRRTLADFEAELDAGRFVRIHRRVIVAVDRIGEMKSLANGDATLQLIDGQQLRVSRRYRETVRKQWAGR
jgi:hypothetical protein